MIVVGDDKKVHLFSITSSGRYERVATMSASRDANFSVSWTANSDKFAVASQDGTVHVWDIRHRDPLYCFKGVGNVCMMQTIIGYESELIRFSFIL